MPGLNEHKEEQMALSSKLMRQDAIRRVIKHRDAQHERASFLHSDKNPSKTNENDASGENNEKE